MGRQGVAGELSRTLNMYAIFTSFSPYSRRPHHNSSSKSSTAISRKKRIASTYCMCREIYAVCMRRDYDSDYDRRHFRHLCSVPTGSVGGGAGGQSPTRVASLIQPVRRATGTGLGLLPAKPSGKLKPYDKRIDTMATVHFDLILRTLNIVHRCSKCL